MIKVAFVSLFLFSFMAFATSNKENNVPSKDFLDLEIKVEHLEGLCVTLQQFVEEFENKKKAWEKTTRGYIFEVSSRDQLMKKDFSIRYEIERRDGFATIIRCSNSIAQMQEELGICVGKYVQTALDKGAKKTERCLKS